MFKHILLPTDGSKLAAKGIKAGMKLAKALGARVTAVYVIAPYAPPRKEPWRSLKSRRKPQACRASSGS